MTDKLLEKQLNAAINSKKDEIKIVIVLYISMCLLILFLLLI